MPSLNEGLVESRSQDQRCVSDSTDELVDVFADLHKFLTLAQSWPGLWSSSHGLSNLHLSLNDDDRFRASNVSLALLVHHSWRGVFTCCFLSVSSMFIPNSLSNLCYIHFERLATTSGLASQRKALVHEAKQTYSMAQTWGTWSKTDDQRWKTSHALANNEWLFLNSLSTIFGVVHWRSRGNNKCKSFVALESWSEKSIFIRYAFSHWSQTRAYRPMRNPASKPLLKDLGRSS